MDFGSLFSGLASSATPWGAVLGGVFGLGKNWLDNKHEAKMLAERNKEKALDRDHDLALGAMEIDGANQAAERALEETKFKTDSSALISVSGTQDAEVSGLKEILLSAGKWAKGFAAFVFTIVTFTQKMIRPFLTVYALALSHYLFLEVNALVGGLETLGEDKLLAIYLRIIITILNLAEAGFLFWFVTRPKKTAPLK